jgi:hypothetical protein
MIHSLSRGTQQLFVLMQINGLGANRLQVWVVGKIHAWLHGLVSSSLVQAMQYAIQMRASVHKGLLNRLLHQVSWILLM